MISLQDSWSRTGFELLVVKSLIPSCSPCKHPLAKSPSQSPGAAGSSGFPAGAPGECGGPAGLSGASHVVLDGRTCTALLPSQLGELTALGTRPSTATANRMLWWLTNAGKHPKEVNHQPLWPINRNFESTLHCHRLPHLPTKAEHIWDQPVAFSGLDALTNLF